MNSGFYAACTALVARTQALDTIASNVANSSSNGFRAQQNVFGTMLASAHNHRLSPINQVTNTYGILSGTHLDDTQGALSRTGNDLDVAIQGAGYFKVSSGNGLVYTRNGSFQVSSTGQLTTSTGDLVLGDAGPLNVAKASSPSAPMARFRWTARSPANSPSSPLLLGPTSPAAAAATTPRRPMRSSPQPISAFSRVHSKTPTSTRSRVWSSSSAPSAPPSPCVTSSPCSMPT